MDWLIKIFVRPMLGSVTNTLGATLRKFARDFRDQAKETDNPWDDVLADLICSILEVD